MTDLKKFAEETNRRIIGASYADTIHELLLAFERVQKESLAARIEWPEDFRIELASLQARGEDFEQGFISGVRWLRDNIRLAPEVNNQVVNPLPMKRGD